VTKFYGSVTSKQRYSEQSVMMVDLVLFHPVDLLVDFFRFWIEAEKHTKRCETMINATEQIFS